MWVLTRNPVILENPALSEGRQLSLVCYALRASWIIDERTYDEHVLHPHALKRTSFTQNVCLKSPLDGIAWGASPQWIWIVCLLVFHDRVSTFHRSNVKKSTTLKTHVNAPGFACFHACVNVRHLGTHKYLEICDGHLTPLVCKIGSSFISGSEGIRGFCRAHPQSRPTAFTTRCLAPWGDKTCPQEWEPCPRFQNCTLKETVRSRAPFCDLSAQMVAGCATCSPCMLLGRGVFSSIISCAPLVSNCDTAVGDLA